MTVKTLYVIAWTILFSLIGGMGTMAMIHEGKEIDRETAKQLPVIPVSTVSAEPRIEKAEVRDEPKIVFTAVVPESAVEEEAKVFEEGYSEDFVEVLGMEYGPITPNIPEESREEDAILIAKVLYGECRGCTRTEQAAVVWVILNRVDAGYGSTITEVVTAPNQFAYDPDAPVLDDLIEVAEDVIHRWLMDRDGVEDVGRVLPRDYLWFTGDGQHNYFRNDFRGANGYWDWSLPSPYEAEG